MLDSYIKEFMFFYRTHFPAATVTPKMHMLQEHTVSFLQRWHLGYGFMGKQGAESIHNSINQLEKHLYKHAQPSEQGWSYCTPTPPSCVPSFSRVSVQASYTS